MGGRMNSGGLATARNGWVRYRSAPAARRAAALIMEWSCATMWATEAAGRQRASARVFSPRLLTLVCKVGVAVMCRPN